MKIRALALVAVILLSPAVRAQDERELYEKYSTMKGVEAVYVSPFMMNLVGAVLGSVSGLEMTTESGEAVDFGEVLGSMSGLYVLDATDATVARRLAEDVERASKGKAMELLMESRSDGNLTRIFASCKGSDVDGIVIFATEPGETSFVRIDCNMKLSVLRSLLH